MSRRWVWVVTAARHLFGVRTLVAVACVLACAGWSVDHVEVKALGGGSAPLRVGSLRQVPESRVRKTRLYVAWLMLAPRRVEVPAGPARRVPRPRQSWGGSALAVRCAAVLWWAEPRAPPSVLV